MLGHRIYGAMTLCFCVLFCEIPQAPNAIGVGYINAFMKNHDFAILSQGISLQYARKGENYGNLYQLNLSHTHLHPSHAHTTSQQSANIGFMGIYDFALQKTSYGYHLLGLEFGLGAGLPAQQGNQFDESSFLLNLDYGYVFELESIALYPYVRLEQYLFFPHKSGADPTDYGLNVFVGLKIMQERSVWQWWVNLGIFSDCNLSDNGVGVLGDNSIVYDRDGLSNGVLTEGGLWLMTRERFSLQARVSASYALSYYEVNLKSALVGIWHF
ncbi:hypothetical protein [uncultured Helicobacter sp.]|uniref:hypothetical protein n=1 Tax=uncultured Helicobacter sp. TaxID=175537 RepID=UPI00374F37FF